MAAAVLSTVFVLSLCAHGTTHSGTSAVGLVRRAVRAPVRVNYRATDTVTVRIGERSFRQRLLTTHRAPDRTSRKYLSGNGAIERVVTDNGRTHWQYLPQQNEVIFSPSLPVDRELWEERDLGQLISNYVVRDAGTTVIEGHKAHLLAIDPRKGHEGPSKRIWTDKATGLILKSELTSSDGRTSVISELANIRIEKLISTKEFASPSNTKKQTVVYEQAAVLPLHALARQWALPILVPRNIPGGYELESSRLIHSGNRAYVHLRYFDGLNTISLFEEQSAGAKQGSVEWQYRAPFRSAVWRRDGVKLTLVGDFSRAKLLKIARSVVRYRD